MGFSVSFTVAELTYAIEADDLDTFVTFYERARGLGGFMATVQELDQRFAEENLADIAKPDQDGPSEPVTTPGVSDELADLIRGAPDVAALTGLYRAHKARWNGDYNKLAGKRRQELDKAAK